MTASCFICRHCREICGTIPTANRHEAGAYGFLSPVHAVFVRAGGGRRVKSKLPAGVGIIEKKIRSSTSPDGGGVERGNPVIGQIGRDAKRSFCFPLRRAGNGNERKERQQKQAETGGRNTVNEAQEFPFTWREFCPLRGKCRLDSPRSSRIPTQRHRRSRFCGGRSSLRENLRRLPAGGRTRQAFPRRA